jgi:membrane protein involved in colicin uptake
MLLGDDELLEETTTPELEQVGIGGSQDPGGSQLSAGPGALAGGSRSRGAAAAAAAAGAAGGSRGSVVLEEVTTKQVLFPIFRPKSCRKCVILVRHGESSEYEEGFQP